MKCSVSWIKEWANPSITLDELCERLTMVGLEIESCEPITTAFNDVVIGEILHATNHPQAAHLNIAKVSVGNNTLLQIVTTAQVREGEKIPVALIGSTLPNGKKILETAFHGISSQGMLCSAADLSLAESSSELYQLPKDAPLGEDIKKYLNLDDHILDINITPNRGDCLSIKGIAREISAVTHTHLKPVRIPSIQGEQKIKIPLQVTAKEACPRYVGRIIRNVNTDAASPLWLTERLRRSNIRSIHPIVDITNYVMLELGQPMHAFDLDTIETNLQVRFSKQGESIKLLDQSVHILDDKTLIIADEKKPLAIAGVMGGLDSSVSSSTKNILLESAFFNPETVARQRQYYNLNSDSAHRFERGVDPLIQEQALQRATQLILEIAGGEVGEVIHVVANEYLPKEQLVTLAEDKVKKVLGISIPNHEIEKIFNVLNFDWRKQGLYWIVKIPSYRFDIKIAEDLLEEIARLYGYNRIPTHYPKADLKAHSAVEVARNFDKWRQLFKDYSFSEVISYSFTDPKLQNLFYPQLKAREILNPISTEMASMRVSLWPGLIQTFLYNISRQQHRIRLFEIGVCFIEDGLTLLQENHLAGLISGFASPEQWGVPAKDSDFYDLKGILEEIFYSVDKYHLRFEPDNHSALHPGQTAAIYLDKTKIGVIGTLHPEVLKVLDVKEKIFLFEVNLDLIQKNTTMSFKEISKFPEIRRDIAILVDQAIPYKRIQDTIRLAAGDWLNDSFIFDVYQGKGIVPGQKSVALALILQHPTRTLVDDEVAELMNRVIKALQGQLGAELRS